jgi:head-tail adaptor
MTLATLLNQTVTVQRRSAGTDDVYGNETMGLTSVAVVQGYVEQTDQTEVLDDRETYLSTHLVLLEAGTPVEAGDRLVVDEVGYEVLGPPFRPYNPRTRTVPHVECRARLVEG